MSEGEITARHWQNGEPTLVKWSQGVITSVEQALAPDEASPVIAPSLVDLQINGYAGIDFQRDGVTGEELLKASRGLRDSGCAKWFLTLITDDWKKLFARLAHFRDLREQSPELRHAVAGWHVEGPFLSPEPGFRGAHPPEVMRDPTAEDIEELRELLPNEPIILTVAPERDSAIAAISKAVELEMKVSIGHANPSSEILRQAVDAGASAVTHLGNGCPQQLDRHDNFLWRVFDRDDLTAGVICDRIHVAPSLFRLIHKALPTEKIYYTTDAMSAAGAGPGRYSIGRFKVEVGEDQVVRQPGQTNFAGSALAPMDGINRAAEMLAKTPQEIWQHFSTIPANLVGLDVGLSIGAPADFCVIDKLENNAIQSFRICANGEFFNGVL